MKTLTITLPTYNESGNIAGIIDRIFEFVPEANVLVVDDNSPDKTADIVKELMKGQPRLQLLERKGKEGLGKAYQHAFSEVLKDPSNELVLMMDADFSHDPMYIPTMIDALDGADVVIGSRYCRGGKTEGWKLWRVLLSVWGNRYCRLVSGMSVNDATAGFNLIRADILRKADVARLGFSGYAFQMELKYLLWKRGARFTEVPIVFKERREGESKISSHIIREGIIAPWNMRFKSKK